MRGTHHAHVDSDGVIVAHSPDFAALQRPQQTGLQWLGKLSDLVEKQCAAVSHLEQSRPMLVGTGEGSLAMPKELALHKMLRQGAAVDSDERPAGTRAALVDGPGH